MDEALAYVNYRLRDDEQVLYEPTWLLVAQWDGVHPHPHGAENRKGLDEEYLEQVSIEWMKSIKYNWLSECSEWSHAQLMICHYSTCTHHLGVKCHRVAASAIFVL